MIDFFEKMPPKKRPAERAKEVEEARRAIRRQRGRWLRGTALPNITEEQLRSEILRGVLTDADTHWIERIQRRTRAMAADDQSPPRQRSRRREEEESSSSSDDEPLDVPQAPSAPPPAPPAPVAPPPPPPPPRPADPGEVLWMMGGRMPRPDSMRRMIFALDQLGVLFRRDGEWYVNLSKFRDLWLQGISDRWRDFNGDEEGLILQYIHLLSVGSHGESGQRQLMRYDEPTKALFIPLPHVYNLRRNLFLYLLRFLAFLPAGLQNVFSSVAGPMAPRSLIGRITIPDNRQIRFGELMPLWVRIVTMFREYITDEWTDHKDEWLDSESGEVIKLDQGQIATFRLSNRDGFVVALGSRWREGIEAVLDKCFPHGGIMTVKNEADNLCLAYSIVIGLCRLAETNFFPRNERYLDLNRMAARITAHPSKAWEVEEARRLLLKIKYRQEGDIFSKMDENMLQEFSTKEACEKLREVEDELIDKRTCLDVYMLRISASGTRRIYPCYMSNRKIEGDDRRIKLLNISVDGFTHFCLITYLFGVFKQTGGKIFEVCSQCHQAFYSRSMFQKHNCTAAGQGNRLEFHWADRFTPEDWPLVEGYCKKCHLLFANKEAAEYHAKHCFMKHRSGTRFVKLSDEPTLSLDPGDEDSEKGHMLGRRKMFFADFECCIREDGVHEVMSYGLYDTTDGTYYTGYSIGGFMTEIARLSKKHKEMHVMFHNAMNYDANFILRYVLRTYKDWSINVIMKSSSRLQSLKFLYQDGKTKRRVRIGDTYSFIGLSLERIVNSVRKPTCEENLEVFPRFFEEFRKKYPWLKDEDIDKVLHKNLFPYKFFVSPDRLDTTIDNFERIFRPAPDNLQYFSENVTVAQLEENYPKFEEICALFRVRTARDYHDIYLLCDVMEITDVFMKARDSIHETHKIDICKYIGMPGATWAAFWKNTPGLHLPLYSDTRMAEFIAENTRGGVTSAPKRYAKATPRSSILYLDVNGLYPYVMQKYKYPCGKLEWLYLESVSRSDPQDYFMNVLCPKLKEEGKGCFIAVDLEFPPEVKKKTAQFPFAPNHELLHDCYYDEDGEMYPFLKRWSEANGGEKMKAFHGLVGTLKKKIEYGVHWKLLRWYVKHGARITKLYHGMKFDEGDYLQEYVRLNIGLRNEVSDEMRKLVYKLLGNALYGKTFEDPFNRCVYLIVRNEEKLTGLLEEGFVKEIIPIDEENCIVKLDGEIVTLDKPTYIGACVTEYAKLHMYKLFYDKLMNVFPKVELIYTDTDSFIVEVQHRAGMTPEQLFAYIDRKCPGLIGKLGGQIKSETGTDDTIDEVIALRSKVYAYRTLKGKIGKRCKGVTAATQEKELDWEAYKECLLSLKAVPTTNVQFERRAFGIKTVELMKISLGANDGKRKILEDGIHTEPWDDENEERERRRGCELL